MNKLLRLTNLISRNYLTKSKSLIILFNSKISSNSQSLDDLNRNDQILNRLKKFRNLGNMQPIVEKFGILWLKSFENKLQNNEKFIVITNKVRISEDHATEIEEFLWEEFMNCKDNIYNIHLSLIEHFHLNKTINQDACIIFLNRTFESWWKQQLNRLKRHVSKNSCHLIQNCTDLSCLCKIEPNLVQKAFDLALLKIFLLSSMNKIYKFEDNFELLKPYIESYLTYANKLNSIKLINELKLNDLYRVDYENTLIPLLIEDKYGIIEEMISSNEKTLYAFIEVCNKICDGSKSFKKIAESYNMNKTHNFSGSKIAKYAINCLRKINKTSLIHTMYPGILFQCKLNQLRFLINSRYNQSDSLISFEGWTELIFSLVGDNENLINQLFIEVINYNKDVLVGYFFVQKYGDKYIDKLPSSAQVLYKTNINLILPDYSEKILQLKVSKNERYYWPDDLSLNDLNFVSNKEEFGKMLDHFEEDRPNIIGLDCEWKPAFGTEDLLDDEDLKSKNQRPDTLQIATRKKVFVVDSRDLIDQLEEKEIDRFGKLVLFSEKMIKLGYDFDQDAKKLYHSFSKFKHVFCEFSDHVININQVVSDFEKKWQLFEAGSNKPLKTKGLSRLTECCFGKPLDKSECMSNWQNRPLRDEQLKYASLDAYVLIKIHDYLQNRIKELNIEYDYVSRSSYF